MKKITQLTIILGLGLSTCIAYPDPLGSLVNFGSKVAGGVDKVISSAEGTVNTIGQIKPTVDDIKGLVNNLSNGVNTIIGQINTMTSDPKALTIINKSFGVMLSALQQVQNAMPMMDRIQNILHPVANGIIGEWDNGLRDKINNIATTIAGIEAKIKNITDQFINVVIPKFQTSTIHIETQVEQMVTDVKNIKLGAQ